MRDPVLHRGRLTSVAFLIVGLGLAGSGIAMTRAAALFDGSNKPSAQEIAVLRDGAAILTRIPGLRSTARQGLMQRMLASDELSNEEHEAAIEDFLEVRPLAPSSWALLAKYRGRTNPRDVDFENAMSMSYLMEAREPRARIVRIETGMTAWSLLSEENRERVAEDINQLIATRGRLRLIGGVRVLKAAVATADSATLSDLRERLAGKPGAAALPKVPD